MPAYKYTLKDGKTVRWRAKFYITDWTGTKRQICKRGFETKRAAKDYEDIYLDLQKNGCDILFSNLVENYMKDMENRLKPTTMETKKHIIDTKVLPYFSKLRTCDIDTIKIRKWQNEIISYRDENGKPYSQTYIKTVNNQLSAILNYAVLHYSLPVNPCRVAGSMGRSHADKMKIWTREEYERFSGQIRKSALRLAFDVLFYTGIREGELLALTPADLLASKKLSITKNFAKVKGVELILEPKTPRSIRTLSIPDFLYDEIHEYISKIYGIQPGDRIFYFTKSSLDKELKAGAERAGLDPIRVHDLRHSHASLLIEMGFNIVQISERLGHESVKTTLDTYAHLYPDKDAALAVALNELRRPSAGRETPEETAAMQSLERKPDSVENEA